MYITYSSTIGKTLIRNTPLINEGVVYKIPCLCGSYYVGQTIRSLKVRKEEHQIAVLKEKESSAIYLHTRECSNPVNYGASSVLYSNNNWIERNLIESACIQISWEENMNKHPGLHNKILNPFSLHVIGQQYKISETCG